MYDADAFEAFFKCFRDHGLVEPCRYIAGVGPLASARVARWMRENIAGLTIPDAVIARLGGAADQRAEGVAVCIETIQRMREVAGLAGVHVKPFRQPKLVADIVRKTGLR